MKRKLFALVAAVGLSMVAFPGAATADQGAEKLRPVMVDVEFVGAFVGGPGTMGCDAESVPSLWAGGGVATHLGRVDIAGFDCTNLTTGVVSNGAATYTAANRDTLQVSYVGQLVPSGDGFVGGGEAVIDGGTGRFASASGGYSWSGTSSPLPDGSVATALEGAGVIAYDASERAD